MHLEVAAVGHGVRRQGVAGHRGDDGRAHELFSGFEQAQASPPGRGLLFHHERPGQAGVREAAREGLRVFTPREVAHAHRPGGLVRRGLDLRGQVHRLLDPRGHGPRSGFRGKPSDLYPEPAHGRRRLGRREGGQERGSGQGHPAAARASVGVEGMHHNPGVGAEGHTGDFGQDSHA